MLKKVLIVDDSPLIHKMYRLVMTRYGCNFLDAHNGQDALDVLARECDIDLVLLDINMPVMNGVQFLEKAAHTQLAQKVPIIVISTEGKEQDTLKGLELGARGYLTKPFQPADLHEMIGRIFRVSA